MYSFIYFDDESDMYEIGKRIWLVRIPGDESKSERTNKDSGPGFIKG